MSLHLIKLCVGVEKVDQLAEWQSMRMAERKAAKVKPLLSHITRMVPKRQEELLDGGSLYWIVKGSIAVRQRLIGIEPFRDKEGIGRCHLVLDPELVLTRPQPRRPFQGWRYLKVEDAPDDMGAAHGPETGLSEKMRAELLELGLL